MSQQPFYGSQRNPMEPLKVPGENQSADAREVEKFHRKSDVDGSKTAQHHTIGTGQSQAASGSHSHDGTDSVPLLSGFTITGTRGTATAVGSIISALKQLGATDSTTP